MRTLCERSVIDELFSCKESELELKFDKERLIVITGGSALVFCVHVISHVDFILLESVNGCPSIPRDPSSKQATTCPTDLEVIETD